MAGRRGPALALAGVVALVLSLLCDRFEPRSPEARLVGATLLSFWLWASVRVGTGIAFLTAPAVGGVRQYIRAFLYAYVFALLSVCLVASVDRIGLVALTLVCAGSLLAVGRSGPGLDRPRPGRALEVVASHPLAAGVALSVGTLAIFNTAWGLISPPGHHDDMSYHLVFPVEWMQTGTLSMKEVPFGNHSEAYYPMNVEVIYTFALLPLRETFHLAGLQLVWLAVAAAALYDSLLLCGARRRAAVLSTSLIVLCPIITLQFTGTYVDLAFSLFLILSIHAALVFRAGPGWRAWIDFAICVGLLVGTKIPGLVFAALVVVPAFCLLQKIHAHRLARMDRQTLCGALAAALVVMLAAGGWWYVRNWIVAGNPVFPLRVELLGFVLFEGVYGRSDLPPSSLATLRYLYLPACVALIGLAAVVGLPAWIARRRGGASARAGGGALRDLDFGALLIVALVVPAAIALVFSTLVPFDYARFAIALYGLSCALLVVPLSAGGPLARAFEGLVAACVAVCLVLPSHHVRLLAPWTWPELSWSPAVMGGFALTHAFLCGLLGLTLLQHPRWRSTAGAGVLALLGLPALWSAAEIANPHGGHASAYVRGVWSPYRVLDERYRGVRIAVTGDPRTFPFFGGHLANRVRYVNVNATRGDLLHDHVRRLGRRGQRASAAEYTRHAPSYGAWIENLRSFGADLVAIQRPPPWADREGYVLDDQGFPLEARWAERDPRRFRLVLRSSDLLVFELLDPARS